MLARFFIDRPIFAWVLSIVLVIAGGICLSRLPIAQYPPIVPPNIQVTATYPGASARTLAETVAQPIEEQVNGVPGMIYMSSACSNNGGYVLNVTFKVGTNLDAALMLVQTRAQLALPLLPPAVQRQGLGIKQQSPDIVLAVNLISPGSVYDRTYLSDYAQIHLYDRLSRVDGVALVNVFGQRQYSMRAWLDPQRMASLDLTADEVLAAIREQNVQVAAGNIGQQPVPAGQAQQIVLDTLGRLRTREQFGAIVVKRGQDGRLVYLRDVARLELGAQNYDLSATLARRDDDGRTIRYPSVALAIFQLPTANSLDVAAAVKRLMEEEKKKFPPGVDYRIEYDTTPYIQESIEAVVRTLFVAVGLVVAVTLVFLQDWRAMLLPIIDIVTSLVGTFAFLALLGFSLNNLSLLGLVVAVGIVVDDSIVVVEIIERWLARGLPVRDATIRAMSEITGPVVGITLVLGAVFIPAAFVPGLSGLFFRQFALTITVATCISAFNALTLAPARAAAWIKPRADRQGDKERGRQGERQPPLPRLAFPLAGAWLGWQFLVPWLTPWMPAGLLVPLASCLLVSLSAAGGWLLSRPINAALGAIFGTFDRAFDWAAGVYTRLVEMTLRLVVVVLVLYVGLLGLTGVGLTTSPTGFIPTQDQSFLICMVELPPGASVQRTEVVLARVQEEVMRNDAVKGALTVAGFSNIYQAESPNWGTVFILLQDFPKRQTAKTQAAALAAHFNQVFRETLPEANVVAFEPPPVRGLGQAGGFQLQIQEGGLGFQALQEATETIVEQANRQPGLRHVVTPFRNDNPEVYLDIDREMAKEMGVSLNDVFSTLTANFGTVYVNEFNEFGRVWQVNVQAEGSYRRDAEQLGLLTVRNDRGQPVLLRSLTKLRPASGPVFVMRYNDLDSAAINGAAAPGYSSGEAIALMQQLCDRHLPPGMSYGWTQLAYQEVTAGDTGIAVFGLGVLVAFLVLAALYESWSLPVAILLVAPLCLLSSVAGLVWIGGKGIDLFAQVGFLVLMGLAAKNAILLVAFARDRRAGGAGAREAVLDACRVRLRPILMTSLAFILGVYPLLMATGAGWEMRRSLGTAVFSGMIGVTLFGIFLTPVFFYAISRLTDRLRSRRLPNPG